ncbi:hypothetical protein C2869_17830 [Saccharobesus litoralis]|uniref:Rieske domain-containing protein n=1 Tax=Saccharobesus litoralis TaxID=2172099 RepID=A0A2S0VVC2_9ALTE|nr:Rieske (2Fe-2S) protein [Saccharobesus litoralis]AWB68159.1 hypothetical protein C2869_17830 [Saccharobesus litoralis]
MNFPIAVTNVKLNQLDDSWSGMAQLSGQDQAYKVLIFKRDESYRLISAYCPHQGLDLTNVPIENDGNLVCPFHGWRIGVFCQNAMSYVVERQGENFVVVSEET